MVELRGQENRMHVQVRLQTYVCDHYMYNALLQQL